MIYFPFSHFYISAFRHLDLSKFYPFADDSNEKKIGFNSRLINRRTFLFRPSLALKFPTESTKIRR